MSSAGAFQPGLFAYELRAISLFADFFESHVEMTVGRASLSRNG
ncbi:hypothetical protein [Rhizobium sp. J15]|nr:hypothetical protein [Rhizobium sp. J15]